MILEFKTYDFVIALILNILHTCTHNLFTNQSQEDYLDVELLLELLHMAANDKYAGLDFVVAQVVVYSCSRPKVEVE